MTFDEARKATELTCPTCHANYHRRIERPRMCCACKRYFVWPADSPLPTGTVETAPAYRPRDPDRAKKTATGIAP